MARMLKWLSYATLSLSLTGGLIGCVPQEKYNAKVLENSSLAESQSDAEKSAAAAVAENRALKTQLQTLSDQQTTSAAMASNLQASNTDLAKQLADYKARYEALNNTPPNITVQAGSYSNGQALPPQLNDALKELAAANPDVIEFDPVRGVVKFKSDVSFATGSHVLTPEAKIVIDKFASILNSSAAAGYELNVAGHTDNVPVTNPKTIAAGDLNNVYLSAHRAISVYSELETKGVKAARMAVVGYGDQRPVADNGTSAGRRLNRRVEVLILPTRHSGAVTASSSAGPTTPKKSAPRELNKDSAALPTDAVMNK